MNSRPSTYMNMFTAMAIGLALLSACGGSGDSVITASEMAAATVSGAVLTGSGSLAAMSSPGRLDERWSLVRSAYAANTCPNADTAQANLNCSVDDTGKALTLFYRDCNFGNNSAVWNGSEVLTSNATVACGQTPSQASGATLLRSFGEGTTRTVGNSVHIASLDTAVPSGYESPVFGGTLMTFKDAGAMRMEIKGVHVLSQKIFRGNGNEGRIQTEADHTISTAEDALEVTVGTGSPVVNGTVQVQHNLDKYTGTSVFQDVTFSNLKGCCLPSSGTVTTTFSGSRTGTETLTFSGSDCGSATMKDEKGAIKDLVLTRCF